MNISVLIFIALVVLGGSFFLFNTRDTFSIPSGTAHPLVEKVKDETTDKATHTATENESEKSPSLTVRTSTRELFTTDGAMHSIPLNEILSGGPGKDGIPSIDTPQFVDVSSATEFLDDTDVGLGLTVEGESRFYPYQILVWHEIVNDTIQGEPVLVTYCPLCATGVVFDPRVDGVVQEFGVSGMLWQSNLLMYNRTGNEDTESLWSQVLGEAVVGPNTGTILPIVRSDTVRFGDWKNIHPDTKVLSRETGAFRSYGRDPYGDYYTNESVSFGASFSDDRLHPKAFVLGIEVNGRYKAYHQDALPVGETTDSFVGEIVTITKTNVGEVSMYIDGQELPYIGGFWFSWLAVHPETELLN